MTALVWPRIPLGRHEPCAWASSASTALDLLTCGVELDDPIRHGLTAGVRLCDVLIQGDLVRRSDTFSVPQLEAQRVVERVERLGGHEFVKRAPEVKNALQTVLSAQAADFGNLRDFFFDLVLLHLRGH